MMNDENFEKLNNFGNKLPVPNKRKRRCHTKIKIGAPLRSFYWQSIQSSFGAELGSAT